MFVSKYGKIDCLQKLLECGVNPNKQDGIGRTALHHVSMFNHHLAIPILLKYHAKIDMLDFSGISPLHLSCWFGCQEACSALLNSGAPIDIQDQSGRTPLYFAVLHKRTSVVQTMLDNKANPKIQNINGITPEALAITEGHVDIIEMFQRYNREHGGSQISETNEPFEKDFSEEHNKMKTVINKLVECKDKQVEEYKYMKDKLEEHNSYLQIIQSNQTDMIQHLNSLEMVLKGVLITVNAMTETQKQLPKMVKPNINPNAPMTMPTFQFPSAPKPNALKALCRLCQRNSAVMRCKNCRSPYCNQCMQTVIKNGCQFCTQISKQ